METTNNIQLHLYYVDKNRHKRGYMKNYNLVINWGNKTYRTFENPYYGYEASDSVEVSKKSDILDYEKLLKIRGFTEEDPNI